MLISFFLAFILGMVLFAARLNVVIVLILIVGITTAAIAFGHVAVAIAAVVGSQVGYLVAVIAAATF